MSLVLNARNFLTNLRLGFLEHTRKWSQPAPKKLGNLNRGLGYRWPSTTVEKASPWKTPKRGWRASRPWVKKGSKKKAKNPKKT